MQASTYFFPRSTIQHLNGCNPEASKFQVIVVGTVELTGTIDCCSCIDKRIKDVFGLVQQSCPWAGEIATIPRITENDLVDLVINPNRVMIVRVKETDEFEAVPDSPATSSPAFDSGSEDIVIPETPQGSDSESFAGSPPD